MISRALGAEQVAQFADFPKFPETESGQNQLVKAFQEAAQDDEHAERMTAWLVRGLHFAPVPADIHEAAVAVVTEGHWEPKRSACAECRGDGFTFEMRGGYSYAIPCTHCRGSVKQIGAGR